MHFLVEGALYFILTTIASYYSFEVMKNGFIDCGVFEPCENDLMSKN